jgi:H+/Cl- antiporter ClcA
VFILSRKARHRNTHISSSSIFQRLRYPKSKSSYPIFSLHTPTLVNHPILTTQIGKNLHCLLVLAIVVAVVVVVVVAEAVQQKKVVVGLKVTVERGVVEERLGWLVLVVILVLFVLGRLCAHHRTFGAPQEHRNKPCRTRSSCTDNHKPDIRISCL